MFKQYSAQIRRTAICAATVLAVSLPGAASAGIFNKVKSNVAKVSKAVNSKTVSIVRKAKAIPNPIKNLSSNLPGSELFDIAQELQLMKQLRETLELLRRVQGDYRDFSGGTFGCEGECQAFRGELKNLFGDLLSLAEEVPVLSERSNLIANIERLSALIDYVPARALYLMWQATGDQIDQVRTAAETIRLALIGLPPMVNLSDIAAAIDAGGAFVADSPLCGWVNKNNKPVLEWVQVELEGLAWALNTIDGFIPDVEIKVDAGVSAGAAVANGEAATGVAIKPTDTLKIALKVAATVPEAINMAIKVSTARANIVCAGAKFVSN
jgi:hypothetical protein